MTDRDRDAEEALWALMAEANEPVAPPRALRSQLLDVLRGPERFAPFAAEVAAAFELEPDAVRRALSQINEPGAWRDPSTLAPPALEQAGVAIVRLPQGNHFAAHTHTRRELTYVLDGELTEDGQRRFLAGELMAKPAGSRHTIAVTGDEPCLVVFGHRDPS